MLIEMYNINVRLVNGKVKYAQCCTTGKFVSHAYVQAKIDAERFVGCMCMFLAIVVNIIGFGSMYIL